MMKLTELSWDSIYDDADVCAYSIICILSESPEFHEWFDAIKTEDQFKEKFDVIRKFIRASTSKRDICIAKELKEELSFRYNQWLQFEKPKLAEKKKEKAAINRNRKKVQVVSKAFLQPKILAIHLEDEETRYNVEIQNIDQRIHFQCYNKKDALALKKALLTIKNAALIPNTLTYEQAFKLDNMRIVFLK